MKWIDFKWWFTERIICGTLGHFPVKMHDNAKRCGRCWKTLSDEY